MQMGGAQKSHAVRGVLFNGKVSDPDSSKSPGLGCLKVNQRLLMTYLAEAADRPDTPANPDFHKLIRFRAGDVDG
jgi:hypothetical protein